MARNEIVQTWSTT